jgi:hypothetical protein
MVTFKKNENYILTARRGGCMDTTIIPQKSFDATTLLGILIDFGLISILVVDGAATGAWSKFDQNNFTLDMQCDKPVVFQQFKNDAWLLGDN